MPQPPAYTPVATAPVTQGVQGSKPPSQGLAVMGANRAPRLFARGADPGDWPRNTEPPNFYAGPHHESWGGYPFPGFPAPTAQLFGEPGTAIPEDSATPATVHVSEPLGLDKGDHWNANQWDPPQTGVYWGTMLHRDEHSDNDRMKPTRRRLFSSWHNAQVEKRMALGGHVVIRRMPNPSGLPGQTPYYQAPNTVRTGQPIRWDTGLNVNAGFGANGGDINSGTY